MKRIYCYIGFQFLLFLFFVGFSVYLICFKRSGCVSSAFKNLICYDLWQRVSVAAYRYLLLFAVVCSMM